MQKMFVEWLQRQVDSPERLREEGVTRFAARLTARLVLATCIINTVGHIVIDYLGLLPYPLWQALVIGLFMTCAITIVAGLTAGGIVGQSILALSIQRDTFERLSNHDQLSGLHNRRSFFERFESEARKGKLFLLDVDHFKKLNDDFGHVGGDEVIRMIGHTLANVFSNKNIIVGRVGGEEFAAFIPTEVDQHGDDLAEAARNAVAAMRVTGIGRPVTVSLGVAVSYPSRPAIEVYAAADRALYLAKASGRNRVVHENMIEGLDYPNAQCA